MTVLHEVRINKSQFLQHIIKTLREKRNANGKLAVQAVVNYVSFCHTCLHRIKGQTDVLTQQQNEKYKRHRSETTLLYQLVERYYPDFTANLAEQGRYLPKYVKREFGMRALF
jgi:hypothetical protein